MHEIPSSGSDFLKEHLALSHSIKEKGYDQNTVLECLQNKVNELLKFQEEAVSLKAELKITTERCNLQAAEFSFVKDELQQEIDHLRENETKLRMALAKAQSEKSNAVNYIDVEARINQESSEIRKLSEKINRSKTKKSQLKQENQSLRDKLSSLTLQFDELRSENTGLKGEISQISENLSQERESSRITNDDHNKTLESSKMLSDQVSTLQFKNNELQQKISKLQQALDTQEKQYKTLKSTYRQKESENSTQTDDFRRQISELKRENADLEMRLKQSNLDFEREKQRAIDLSQTQEISDKSKQDAASTINALQFENQELKSKTLIQERQLKNYEENKIALKEKEMLLDHIELERKALANSLSTEPDPIEGPWTNLHDRVAEAVHGQNLTKSVTDQNEKLKARLKAALDQSATSEKALKQKQQEEEEDQYVSALKSSLDGAQKRINNLDEKIAAMEFQRKFATSIEISNSKLMKEIAKLHLSLHPELTHIRALVLAVIMMNRISKMKVSNSYRDENALSLFRGRQIYSPMCMVEEIRKSFRLLTQDLVDCKSNLVQALKDREKLTTENQTLTVQVNTYKDENKIEKKRTKFLKKRMIEMQQELSLLVPSEEYQDACKAVQTLQEKLIAAKQQHSQYLEQISEIKKQLDIMRTDKETVDGKLSQSVSLYNEIRIQLKQSIKEIETLHILLEEKNKEILALERVVQRQKSLEKTASAAFANLKLGEEDQIQFEEKIETATLANQEPSFSLAINPAFLK